MCDHQRQLSSGLNLLPCAEPSCEEGTPAMTEGYWEWDTGIRYSRETYLPAPEGTPQFWFWLRRDAK